MNERRDDLAGVDDSIAEHALARRALVRRLADWTRCGRQITHPRRPSEFDVLGCPEVNTCTCIRPAGHDHGCWCAHDIGRYEYRVDADLPEHRPTRPLGTTR